MMCEFSSDTEDKFRSIWLQNIWNIACDSLFISLNCNQQFIAWLYQTQWWVFSLLGNDVPAWQLPVSKTGQLAMQRDCMFNISPFYVKERFIIPLWKQDRKKYHLFSGKTSKIVKFFFLIGQGTFQRGSATWLPKQRIDRSLWFIELFNDKALALICSENTRLLEVCSVIKLEDDSILFLFTLKLFKQSTIWCV